MQINEHTEVSCKIENTINAGDAFTAAMIHGFLRVWELSNINEYANKVGAFVASKDGTMPDFSELETL